jgi:hypothetical protein
MRIECCRYALKSDFAAGGLESDECEAKTGKLMHEYRLPLRHCGNDTRAVANTLSSFSEH